MTNVPALVNQKGVSRQDNDLCQLSGICARKGKKVLFIDY
jgi:hypothetical protein